jgi:hypothetical protein
MEPITGKGMILLGIHCDRCEKINKIKMLINGVFVFRLRKLAKLLLTEWCFAARLFKGETCWTN